MKAWVTTAIGISSVVFAETRGKAKATTVDSANDAGWGVRYTQVRALRAPQWDQYADQNPHHRCIGQDYLVGPEKREELR